MAEDHATISDHLSSPARFPGNAIPASATTSDAKKPLLFSLHFRVLPLARNHSSIILPPPTSPSNRTLP